VALEKYSTTLTQADLMDNDTIAVLAGIPIKLGEYQVQAGEEIAIGFGPFAGQESAIGRIYAEIMDDTATAAEEPGMLRLSVWDPQNRPLIVLGEWRTETLSSGASDRSLRIPLPESNINLTEDQKLVLEFISDASDTVVKASSTIAVDCTRYRVRKR
jgi:hypothetical protein